MMFGCFLLASVSFAGDFSFMPRDHHALTQTISYANMQAFLKSVGGNGIVDVSEEATTTKGRSLYLVHLSRSNHPTWKILFYAQQHGDEISGKDALLYLIRDVAEKPELLPPDVDVWILPMMNPDGAEAGTRVNGACADLNRDHMTLDQPETIALHKIARRVQPDVAVDCHEFARESEGYSKRGWMKWPDITMDSLNNPMFDRGLVAAGERWVAEAAAAEKAAGHPFLQYWVGGTPPDDEQRHSAPDIDSGMNAIGTYGGLSFIIEAAARKGDDSVARELGNRVDAYLVILRLLVKGDGHREADLAAIRSARGRKVTGFIPTNYLWANPASTVTAFPVIDSATGKTVEVPTPNMMTQLVVKKSVPAPAGYVVEPRAAVDLAPLLDRHGITYVRLSAAAAIEAETCRLLRVENEFDDVYSRYEGRQIVVRNPVAKIDAEAGSLWISLDQPSAIRAALLLEPASLYGLYQYDRYKALAAADGMLPVLRVAKYEPGGGAR